MFAEADHLAALMWQDSYLYARMYYNKIRKTAHQWWRTYLLFKCCIVVVPIYSFLLLIGLYCIINNIDVTSPLKTFYELAILIFSAAAIFIIVLLLATLNGDGTSIEQLDIDPELMIESEFRLNRRRSRNNSRQEPSLSSTIMTTLFGNFDDPDDPDYDEDEDEMENVVIVPAGESPIAQLSLAQNRLIDTMEQTTDNLEYFFDQCDTFDSQLIPPPPPQSSNSLFETITSKSTRSTNQLYQSLGTGGSNHRHYPLLAPPLPPPPPVYSTESPEGKQNFDLPPSYEEATRSD